MPLGCFFGNNKQNMRHVDINENRSYFQYAQAITKSVQSHVTPTCPRLMLAAVTYLIRDGKIKEILEGLGVSERITLSNLGNCDSIVKINTGSVKLVGQYFSVSMREGF